MSIAKEEWKMIMREMRECLSQCLNRHLSDDSKKISQLTSLPTLQAQTHAACSTPSACAPSPIGFAIALAAPLNAEDKADPLNTTTLDSTAGDINDDVSESTVDEYSDSVVGVLVSIVDAALGAWMAMMYYFCDSSVVAEALFDDAAAVDCTLVLV
ncbi:hypothetical protein C8J56DRAFT_897236 [Mycena floridula]|nr:hypothetical protein C8J56DRAFT_897236 [Mycena floridula]